MAEVGDDDLFGEDGDSDSSGGDIPDDPFAEDNHAPCVAEPEEGGVLQLAAMVEALVPSADAPGEAQERDQDGSRGGGEEKVKADATAAPCRPRKQLPGKPPHVAIQAVATSVGKGGDDVWEGVERGPGGVIVKIRWANMDLKGSLPVADWGMPHLTEFDVSGNANLIGRIDEVQWPKTLISITMRNCFTLTGDLGKVVLPAGLTAIDLYECSSITGDISRVIWPEGLTLINLYRCSGIAGDLGATRFPPGLEAIGLGCTAVTGLKKLDLRECYCLTGDLSKVTWPEGLTEIYLYRCFGITGDKGAAKAKLEAAGCKGVWL